MANCTRIKVEKLIKFCDTIPRKTINNQSWILLPMYQTSDFHYLPYVCLLSIRKSFKTQFKLSWFPYYFTCFFSSKPNKMNKLAMSVMLKRACCQIPRQSSLLLQRKYSFESDLSLRNIYPSSNLRLYTPAPPKSTTDKFTGFIPLDKLQITYSRSSGPGGQNVNTVSTKVDVRFHLDSANWLSETVRTRLAELQRGRITKEGYLVIKSELTRSQQMNMADALEKLRSFIREAEKPQTVELSPETVEKLRRRHERSIRERLSLKRSRSQTKADRRDPTL
ncbi:peptidyl-tRNA hydrolase ICT1, mitochondrial [Wyeomyia smithii]|uniref:peptidyl-tRNA hydrolase ICT1, mitochondrial n=1 Tax=Wyeomyia smithii TaxID=174621 RepID=UPI002467B8E6|nr:peptidyl-tRNA hydrolase ICT1, mitochondrial [Wyeomyia smithii]